MSLLIAILVILSIFSIFKKLIKFAFVLAIIIIALSILGFNMGGIKDNILGDGKLPELSNMEEQVNKIKSETDNLSKFAAEKFNETKEKANLNNLSKNELLSFGKKLIGAIPDRLPYETKVNLIKGQLEQTNLSKENIDLIISLIVGNKKDENQ